MSKARRSCDLCGETDHKLKRLVIKVDGRRWKKPQRLCRVCLAVLLVRFTSGR